MQHVHGLFQSRLADDVDSAAVFASTSYIAARCVKVSRFLLLGKFTLGTLGGHVI